MGNVFSLFAFLMSIVAVLLAGLAFFRVEMRLAEGNRLAARKNYELKRISEQNARYRAEGRSTGTFSDADLAGQVEAPAEASRPDPEADAYSRYPSQKSIELALELDRKRQEARRLAAEAGLTIAEEEAEGGPTFAPSIGTNTGTRG